MIFKKMLWTVVDMAKLKNDIAMLKDGEYEIVPYKKDRTNDQNRYLWWWVYGTISKEVGEDDIEYIHYVMGRRFLTKHDKKEPYIQSTAKLNTAEFSDYVEKIRKFMLEKMNIYIPTPDEYLNSNKHNG